MLVNSLPCKWRAYHGDVVGTVEKRSQTFFWQKAESDLADEFDNEDKTGFASQVTR